MPILCISCALMLACPIAALHIPKSVLLEKSVFKKAERNSGKSGTHWCIDSDGGF